ncbi:MAG: hypothetical protein CMG75_04810 [Candidatus Marinimicrobia bacterium]|nr:hypothetical protein [Candidatus Neomarinimicrobiota bacterium]|tara:strand:- start:20635 stop:21558 length:924 start_codon:yes stop_codon:yes gene_type:complete
MKNRTVILLIAIFSFISCSNDDDNSSDSELLLEGVNIQTLSHDGLTREYYIYIPDSYDGSSEFPLILNFHGYGGDPLSQLYIADMRMLADSENFILVYPQGSPENGDGSNTEKDGYLWNTMLPSDSNKSNADDFGFIEQLINEISSNYNLDQSRVYACGYSNGAGFSYSLACYLSDKIAAIGSVSGLMWEGVKTTCNPTHPTAVISFNGTSDNVRPYDGIEDYLLSVDDMLNYWAGYNKINDSPLKKTVNTMVEHYIYSGGDQGVSLEHYKIIKGSHDWFEIKNEGSNINSLIWEFLSRFDLNGLRE